jgi:hypothetical protein
MKRKKEMKQRGEGEVGREGRRKKKLRGEK